MRALGIGIAIVVVIAGRRHSAADGPLIAAFTATIQELRDDGKHPTYHVPFEPVAGVDPSSIEVGVVRVSVGALDDTSLIAAFVPVIVTAPPGPRIAITVHFSSFTRPATYAHDPEDLGPAMWHAT